MFGVDMVRIGRETGLWFAPAHVSRDGHGSLQVNPGHTMSVPTPAAHTVMPRERIRLCCVESGAR